MRIGRGFFVPTPRTRLAPRQRPNPRNPALPTLPNPQSLDQRVPPQWLQSLILAALGPIRLEYEQKKKLTNGESAE